MSPDNLMAVRMDAFAVGMKAKVGDLPQQDVDEMVTRAEQLLDTSSPLYQAVSGFAVQYEVVKHNKVELFRIGNVLTDYISNLNIPTPPDMGRKDIHG